MGPKGCKKLTAQERASPHKTEPSRTRESLTMRLVGLRRRSAYIARGAGRRRRAAARGAGRRRREAGLFLTQGEGPWTQRERKSSRVLSGRLEQEWLRKWACQNRAPFTLGAREWPSIHGPLFRCLQNKRSSRPQGARYLGATGRSLFVWHKCWPPPRPPVVQC